jgi:hypothetical protein
VVTPWLTTEMLRLLDEVLDSIEKVEIARHLTAAKVPLPVPELQARTQIDTQTMRGVMADLVRDRVIAVSGAPVPTVQLAARARRSDFEALMKLYAADRPVVMAALSSISMSRIRSMAARAFGEAFVLRKKKKEGDP